jgi:hypothetical protein
MKRFLSLILAFSLFLSSCSTLTDVASGTIDDVAKSTGISKIGGATSSVKKVVIPKKTEWNDGDDSFREDFVRLPKAQTYLEAILNDLLSYSKVKDNDFSIYVLRTARVQGMAAWGMWISGTEVRITRGMFNMIYDEAETACLIGHEIGHVVLHREKQNKKPLISNDDKTEAIDSVADIVLGDNKYKGTLKRQQKKVLKTNWGREEEKEADKYGAELAAKAGYDPYAFCDLFERLAGRVDLGLMYRFQKIEGSHPALDDRAKSLREYLQKKGYKEGEGNRNRQEYLDGMSELFEISTGEDKKDNKKIQKGIDEEGKKDLKRLDAIFKEVESLSSKNKSLSMSRFIEIMGEISDICKKYGVTAEDIFGGTFDASDSSFMEESIVQDSPFWEMLKSIKDAVTGKVSNILGVLGRVAIGSMPVIGDVIDVYELVSGKDFFTGEKLSAFERALSAFGVLIGSGSAFRTMANSFDSELARFAGKIPATNISEARSMLKTAIEDVEVVGDWKRVDSKIVNEGFKPDKLPYRTGMNAFEGVVKNDEVFYRVYSENMEGVWLVKFDPSQMSPKELKELLALPELPTAVAKVKVPKNTVVRVGNAGENMWGKGGLTQWEIRNKDGSAIFGKNAKDKLKELKIIFEKVTNLK